MVPDRSQQARADFSSSRPLPRADFGAVPQPRTQVVEPPTTTGAEAASLPIASAQPVVPVPVLPVLTAPGPVVRSPEPSVITAPQIPPSVPIQIIPSDTSQQLPVAPNTSPVQPLLTTQPSPEPEADLDNLLKSVATPVMPEPVVPVKPTNKYVAWLHKHHMPLKIGGIAAAALFVVFASFSIYRGYTHNTPFVGIARPVPVSPVQSKDTTVVTAADFQERSADAARVATINALKAKVEAYYVAKGYYPSETDMQSLGWIAQNFTGFDLTSIKDPDSSIAMIGSKPGAGQYAYQAGVDLNLGACDNTFSNCNYYVLTATLSNGKTYSKVAIQ